MRKKDLMLTLFGNFVCCFFAFTQTKTVLPVQHGSNFERSSLDQVFVFPRNCYGVAAIDINNDLYVDLFFNNMKSPCDLYINNMGRKFQKTDAGNLVNNVGMATGQAWADYDNDGLVDVLITYQDCSGNRLYRNLGNGKFKEMTLDFVTTDKNNSFEFYSTHKTNSFHPAWIDLNRDGYVDLLVTNCTYFANKPDTSFLVYLNDKSGRFKLFNDNVLTKLTVSSTSSIFCDYDSDGDPDLLVTTWGKGAFILKNDGNGVFRKLPDLENATGNLITGTWADYDNDGDFDIFITRGHPDDTTNLLYKNIGNDKFIKVLNSEITKPVGKFWNAAWGDYDNDGDLDLCYTDLMRLTYLFENDGKGNFTRITNNIIVTDTTSKYTCSNLWADYDNNGKLDLILPNIKNGESLIFRNMGNTNKWLLIKLEGTVSNKSAIGAVVKIKTMVNGKVMKQIRQVSSVEGFRTVNHMLHFGLGNLSTIDEMTILWPNGQTQILKDVKVNRVLTIVEPQVFL
jgi:enediyne biosynthesis protein E4